MAAGVTSGWQLAQINIGRLVAPAGDPRVQPFFDASGTETCIDEHDALPVPNCYRISGAAARKNVQFHHWGARPAYLIRPSNQGRSARKALARWLTVFLNSSPSSAKVATCPSGMKRGSYPKPLAPARSSAICPSQVPFAITSVPSVQTRATTQTNRAVRSAEGIPSSRRNRRAMFSSSDACSPAKRAERTPGLPASASTSRPLSSPSAAQPLHCAMPRALRRAFSRNVVPVSSMIGGLPMSSIGRHVRGRSAYRD